MQYFGEVYFQLNLFVLWNSFGSENLIFFQFILARRSQTTTIFLTGLLVRNGEKTDGLSNILHFHRDFPWKHCCLLKIIWLGFPCYFAIFQAALYYSTHICSCKAPPPDLRVRPILVCEANPWASLYLSAGSINKIPHCHGYRIAPRATEGLASILYSIS